jgi:hypothetical protein
MVREAERNAEEDKKQREAVDMKNQVTTFLTFQDCTLKPLERLRSRDADIIVTASTKTYVIMQK